MDRDLGENEKKKKKLKVEPKWRDCGVGLCESRSRSVLTVCSAPVVREKVSARVLLLRVGLATLRLSL